MINKSCPVCDTVFSVYPSQRKTCCSRECMGIYRREKAVKSGKCWDHKPLRKYLIENGTYECTECGNKGEWMGKPLTLHLDHIDGNPRNNCLENVRWLCPNCHHQTDNWGVLNMAEENRHKLRTNLGM